MNNKNIVKLITVVTLLSSFVATPVVADSSKVDPEQPVVTPQCWFICPPDNSSDE
ncbi:hypothetical protein ORJ04_07890 [Rheinheimera baltica]|uniref:Porin n=1 Tax=Rheinheimera baltica TaxID=67576 RepID=A0ABT9HXL7_9GAMM|nr:hypothetical protein [Rheinheimera baltica]MDP5135869.1 hypothetical protein [Rheinheimera baltica]